MSFNNEILSLYIPRIGGHHTEQSVMQTFHILHVGRVAFVDFVAIKEKDAEPQTKTKGSKPTKFYSAFVQMAQWNPHCIVYNEIQAGKRHDLIVDRNLHEFWMLLPSKAEMIPRSRVNTHQLAAYTSELFDAVAGTEKSIENYKKKIEEQSAEIDALKVINKKMEERLAMIEAIVFAKPVARCLSAEFGEMMEPPPVLMRRASVSSNYYDSNDFINTLTNGSTSPVLDRRVITDELCGNL
jgi:predicted ATP-dependent protease